MNSVIIIPSLNPNVELLKLIKKLKNLNLNQIIIIDDGSLEEYKSIYSEAENLNCEVIHHIINMGKGEAIKTGILNADKIYRNISSFITVDSDGQHKSEDVLKLSKELEINENDIILGVRNFNNSNVPFKSKYGNKFSSIFFKLKTGVTCNDTQTGLRGIPYKYKNFSLNIDGSRYDYEMNFLIECTKKRINFKMVYIDTIYENNNSCSHFRPFKDSILIYKQPLKFLLASITSALIDLILFSVMISVKKSIILSTAFSRVISGMFNFSLNKKWSFKSKGNIKKEGLKYLALFIIQMLLSSVLVTLLCYTYLNIIFIKIIVDLSLFIISYFIQKKYIFLEVQ